ncbi:hypothetical protein MAHJHV33_50210 [Mycobacterium avium subsp. hominissuis]
MAVIGGGDTGADCLGTVHRQGATEVHQFEIMPRPPDTRAPSTPWPTYPLMYRVSSPPSSCAEDTRYISG